MGGLWHGGTITFLGNIFMPFHNLFLGLCTDLDRSTFLVGVVLRQCGRARRRLSCVSSPLVRILLRFLDLSFKTDSPSGAGRGTYPHTLLQFVTLLLNFSFQCDPNGFSCWIATAFIHFILFWTLTWSDISWCNLTPACFLGLLPLLPQIIVWAAAIRVSNRSDKDTNTS